MKVCVTGAAGFIGSNLCKDLVDGGHSVVGIDDLSSGHIEFLPKGVRFYPSDFAATAILNELRFQKVDVVVHLAAIPRVSYSVEHPIETNDTNVTKTLALIDAACKAGVKRFVFASSSSVYGGALELPTTERCHRNPQSPYALQKSLVEDYLRMWSRFYGLDTVSLRFFNVFGPHALGSSPYATAISSWLTAIKEGRPMRSDGDGTQSRDLCYVDNVIDCIVRASDLTRAPFDGEAINVACGASTTNNYVLQYLTERYPGSTCGAAPGRAGDVKHTLADIGKAKHLLGYRPLVHVEEGIDRTCDWYDANWEWLSKLPRKGV